MSAIGDSTSGAQGSRKGIALLGSTGSIGVSTLEVVRAHPERFSVVSLAAGANVSLLRRQVEEFRPEYVSVFSEDDAKALSGSLPGSTRVGSGVEGASRAAQFDGVDMVVSAIGGAAGLVPTLAALNAGKDVALANKETLVLAGALVMDTVKSRAVRLLPVDSEHSAVFQSLTGHRTEDVKRIILTASGGPFLDFSAEELATVTPEQALNHPRWSMGRKITIDSATLMNKGLEVIEARWLFDLPPEKISVCVHPQSIVHSMVEYIDGSMVAQLSNPDMKGPIAYALGYPERIDSLSTPLSLAGLTLEFLEPDMERFPCLGLAYRALESGGLYPAVLNAADEVAVGMFLNKKIGFADIYTVISRVFDGCPYTEGKAPSSVDEVLEADRWAREHALGAVNSLT